MIWLIGLILVVLGGITVFFVMGKTQRQVYKYSFDNRVLDNPDKGYYIQIDSSEVSRIPSIREEVRVVLIAYDIEQYASTSIGEEKIEELRTVLAAAKENGLGVVFRAAYGFHAGVHEPSDTELISEHIGQISDVLNEYKDIIMVVQAGLLGDWGEWHSGDYLVTDEVHSTEIRQFVLKHWEQHLEETILVSVRRPRFIREAWEAGILVDRLGLYNDALLSTFDDMGTYDDANYDRIAELNWMQETLTTYINGGEMPTTSGKTEAAYADTEFSQLHMTYLNCKYNMDIISQWEETEIEGMNASDYIEQKLGYQLSVQQITSTLAPANSWDKYVDFTLKIQNIGYSTLSAKYKIYGVLMQDGKEIATEEITSTLLYQINNGQSTTLNFRIPFANYHETTDLALGIKITKYPEDNHSDYFVELANDVGFEDGINVFKLH